MRGNFPEVSSIVSQEQNELVTLTLLEFILEYVLAACSYEISGDADQIFAGVGRNHESRCCQLHR